MANRGWSNGGGEQTSSTARQSGIGTNCSAADGFIQGSKIAHPSGGDDDALDKTGDLFEANGQLSVTESI